MCTQSNLITTLCKFLLVLTTVKFHITFPYQSSMLCCFVFLTGNHSLYYMVQPLSTVLSTSFTTM